MRPQLAKTGCSQKQHFLLLFRKYVAFVNGGSACALRFVMHPMHIILCILAFRVGRHIFAFHDCFSGRIRRIVIMPMYSEFMVSEWAVSEVKAREFFLKAEIAEDKSHPNYVCSSCNSVGTTEWSWNAQ